MGDPGGREREGVEPVGEWGREFGESERGEVGERWGGRGGRDGNSERVGERGVRG